MKRSALLLLALVLFFAAPARPDTVVLHDGSSYSGQLTIPATGELMMTTTDGVEYSFPVARIQSIVFTPSADIITLRDGSVYSGRYNGVNPIGFTDNQGVGYQFPLKDVASIIFSRNYPPPPPPAPPAGAITKVIPAGTQLVIRTGENIDSEAASPGQLFSAAIDEDVVDASGNIAIPRGTPAKVVIRNIQGGGAVHSAEIALDLFSINLAGVEYRVLTNDVDINNKSGIGANKRTAEFGGGGAAVGALLGGIFGGGKGAGIGAAAGAGGGFLTQLFTRGKVVKVPAESVLRFRLDRTLVLRHLASY
jgi:hypothetical protein